MQRGVHKSGSSSSAPLGLLIRLQSFQKDIIFCIFSWHHVTAQLLRSRAVFTTQREVTRRDLADGVTFSCDVFQETARGEDVSARWKCQMKGFYLAPSEEKESYSEMFRVWKIQRCNTSGES